MALIPSKVISKKQEIGKKSGASKGALIGAGLGAAAAIIAAPATGGLSLAAVPGIIGAAGTGSAIGGQIGGAVQPGQLPQAQGQAYQAPLLSSNSRQMIDSAKALAELPKAYQQEFGQNITQALAMSMRQDMGGRA